MTTFSKRATSLASSVTDVAALESYRRDSRIAALARKADEAGIPHEVDLRRVVMAAGLIETPSSRAVHEAQEWRASRNTEHGTAKCARVIGGTVGSGKTVAMARAVTRHNAPSSFVTSTELAATPRNSYSTNEEAWRRWLDVDLLGVDDAGVETGDPAILRTLLVLRYDAGLFTLVTSNLNKATFAKRYMDARLTDRLGNGQQHPAVGEGLPWFVSVTGESLRDARALAAVAKGAL